MEFRKKTYVKQKYLGYMTSRSFETQLYTKFDSMDSVVILKYEAEKNIKRNLNGDIFH